MEQIHMREKIDLNKHKKNRKHSKKKNKQFTQMEAEKDIVIQSKGHKQSNASMKVPKAMDPLNMQEATALPVYTQKQWIADKDEVDDMNMKTAPSIAEIKMPGKDNKSGSDFKVVYDYDDPRYYENLQLSDGSEANKTNTTIIKLDKVDAKILDKSNTPVRAEANKTRIDPLGDERKSHNTEDMAKDFDKKSEDKPVHTKDDTIIETKNTKKTVDHDHTPGPLHSTDTGHG